MKSYKLNEIGKLIKGLDVLINSDMISDNTIKDLIQSKIVLYSILNELKIDLNINYKIKSKNESIKLFVKYNDNYMFDWCYVNLKTFKELESNNFIIFDFGCTYIELSTRLLLK